MKIIFLARRYAPHLGGVEKHLDRLNRELLKNAPKPVQITIITEQYQASLPAFESINQITVQRIPLPSGNTDKMSILKWIWNQRYLFFTADIIHIHDVFFWILLLFPWLWLKQKKLFITFHGYEGPGNPNWKQRFWHQLAAKLTAGNICIGGFHQKWYGVKPTVTSFGAVELVQKKLKKIPKTKNTTRILYLGRLSADIGILKYLAALKIIAAKQSVTLDVFGDGPDAQAAHNFVAKHQLPVRFYGFVPSEKIPWQKYDRAFVSGYLSILEAMGAGLPIIAQYHAPIKYDYLKDTPFGNWIVIAGSAAEIVTGWQRATSPNFQKNIVHARVWAQQQTWQKLTNQYLQLWQRN